MSEELKVEIKKAYAQKKSELAKDASSMQNDINVKLDLSKKEIYKEAISN